MLFFQKIIFLVPDNDVFGKKEKKPVRLGKSSCILFHSSLFEAKNIELQGLPANFLAFFFGDLVICGISGSETRKYWRTDIGGKLNKSNENRRKKYFCLTFFL